MSLPNGNIASQFGSNFESGRIHSPVGCGVGFFVGFGVTYGDGFGVGFGVYSGEGFGVGFGVYSGDGFGVGAVRGKES